MCLRACLCVCVCASPRQEPHCRRPSAAPGPAHCAVPFLPAGAVDSDRSCDRSARRLAARWTASACSAPGTACACTALWRRRRSTARPAWRLTTYWVFPSLLGLTDGLARVLLTMREQTPSEDYIFRTTRSQPAVLARVLLKTRGRNHANIFLSALDL